MKIKEEILACGSFEIKDGKQTRFWEDTWMGQRPFKDQYPRIYNIARRPHASVASVLSSEPLNISFRRALVDEKLQEWLDLVAKITNINLVEGRDHFKWNLHGIFTVRSMYLHKMNQHAPFCHKLIWKLKIPLKIKIFFWYLQRGVILTKDNLVRKNWKGSLKCCFYNCNESITHLLFDCHHAKEFWRIVYLATGLIPPRSVSHMLGNWLSNFSDKEGRVILVGAAALC